MELVSLRAAFAQLQQDVAQQPCGWKGYEAGEQLTLKNLFQLILYNVTARGIPATARPLLSDLDIHAGPWFNCAHIKDFCILQCLAAEALTAIRQTSKSRSLGDFLERQAEFPMSESSNTQPAPTFKETKFLQLMCRSDPLYHLLQSHGFSALWWNATAPLFWWVNTGKNGPGDKVTQSLARFYHSKYLE